MKSIIDQLAVSAEDRYKKLTPVMFRRYKLVKALHEQLQVAEEYLNGRQYMRRFMRSETDPETNKRITIMSERPARRWFWIDDEASLLIQVRYGNKVLKVRDEKSTVVIGDKDHLVPTLQLLKQAAEAGEFDAAIQATQKPFGRPIPSVKDEQANKRNEKSKKLVA